LISSTPKRKDGRRRNIIEEYFRTRRGVII